MRVVMREAVVGIDVGGTRIKSALVTPDGQVLAEAVRPTPDKVGEQLGEVAAKAVVELTARVDEAVDLLAVGVAVPGLVDDVTGIGVWSANLGWRDLDLRGSIAAHVDVPVAIGHDVRSGLLAEHRLGAAREADNVLFVPLGTGLASAILCRGQLVTGSLWTGRDRPHRRRARRPALRVRTARLPRGALERRRHRAPLVRGDRARR